MKQVKIASRGSKLALAQSNWVLQQLSGLSPDTSISIVEISTKGDRDRSDFLYKSNSVGFFTSEVERALLDGRADIAVHSLKDLPTAITGGLAVTAIPAREQVSDVIVAARPLKSLDDLPPKAVIGTSSLRRITQLKRIRPDLECRPLRGNVETRINKVHQGQLDAVIIAQAGLNRLGLSDRISLVLTPEDFIPAPGQGALAVQTRQDDVNICKLVATLEDRDARITTQTERTILAGLHGGCSIPLGVYSHIENDTIHIHAILCNLDATKCIEKRISCPLSSAQQTTEALTRQILNEGGSEILDEIRAQKQNES